MAVKKIPTKKELLHLQKLYRTDKRIGQALGDVSEHLVAYWRRKKGIGRSVFPKYSFIEIKELWERFGDDYKAGQQLTITKQAFYRWRKKYDLLERPAILKLEQLELKFFDEHRFNRKGEKQAPAQTFLQKVISYRNSNQFVAIDQRHTTNVHCFVDIDKEGLVVTTFPPGPGRKFDSKVKYEKYESVLDMVESGHFIPGRIIASRHLEAAGLAVTASYVHILPKVEPETGEIPRSVDIVVEPSLKVVVSGGISPRLFPFDIACQLATTLSNIPEENYVIELSGIAVERLSLEERVALISYCTLLLDKRVLIEPDQTFLTHLQRFGENIAPVPFSDRNAYYLDCLNVALSHSQPRLYSLRSGKYIEDYREFSRKNVKRVRIGPLIGGDLESIKYLVTALRGKHLKKGLEVYLIPCTRKTFTDAAKKRFVQYLLEVGVRIGNTCHQPPLKPLKADEYELTTEINRVDYNSYLTSIQTICMAAQSGNLTRKLLEAAS